MAAVAPTRDKAAPIRRRGRLAETWLYLRRSKSGMLGLTILVIHLLIALSSPLIVAHDPTDIDASLINKSPSREYPLGTDQFGRDVLTRVLLGGRIALAITLTATVIAVTWGARSVSCSAFSVGGSMRRSCGWSMPFWPHRTFYSSC